MNHKKLLRALWILFLSGSLAGILPGPGAGMEARAQPLQPPFLLFLPMVMLKSTSPPQEIANPGFEESFTGWTFYSNQGYDTITPVESHSGYYSASLGNGKNDRVASISQTMQVPISRSKLAYWIFTRSGEVCLDFDYLKIFINGQERRYYDICANNQTNQWVYWDLDLSSNSGQMVVLKIEFRSDASVSSEVYLDDFQFTYPP